MPFTAFATPEKYSYQNGFQSYHEQAFARKIKLKKSPPYGLYAEKSSGTAFTAPRYENLQTWLYRIIPAAAHTDFVPYDMEQIANQLRWNPFDIDENVDWIHSFKLVSGAGTPTTKTGLGIYIFSAGKNMESHDAFYSADGDFLIVPQHGVLDIQTELGRILARPNEIVVIPRGIRYRVTLLGGPVRGYILELYQGHFQLSELGLLGSNGLANARDFQAPIAAYEQDANNWNLVAKFNNRFFKAQQNHSPFNYDLGRFNVIGSTSFDHPDPSTYTVLTGPSDHLDTFRPPWYHRNTISEFMGLVHGNYNAKTGGGFKPAGASLHNIMSAHGPDSSTHERASNSELVPQKIGTGSMAFMFESCLMLGVNPWGLKTCEKVQNDYNEESWMSLKSHFRPPMEEGDKV
ncbi:homogentisate 1,2-dioxygenase [Stipitochalara longipes BDJ]|nr:homogentisate 1,2-dioxygenase [Stipitochalara longipes BDJ]